MRVFSSSSALINILHGSRAVNGRNGTRSVHHGSVRGSRMRVGTKPHTYLQKVVPNARTVQIPKLEIYSEGRTAIVSFCEPELLLGS